MLDASRFNCPRVVFQEKKKAHFRCSIDPIILEISSFLNEGDNYMNHTVTLVTSCVINNNSVFNFPIFLHLIMSAKPSALLIHFSINTI